MQTIYEGNVEITKENQEEWNTQEAWPLLQKGAEV